jgi:hypothetical protein
MSCPGTHSRRNAEFTVGEKSADLAPNASGPLVDLLSLF